MKLKINVSAAILMWTQPTMHIGCCRRLQSHHCFVGIFWIFLQVTLIGWSLGARVIFSALEALAAHESGKELLEGFTHTDSCLGIIENVYLLGAAVTANPSRWEKYVDLTTTLI
jgi:hypothetical protein